MIRGIPPHPNALSLHTLEQTLETSSKLTEKLVFTKDGSSSCLK